MFITVNAYNIHKNTTSRLLIIKENIKMVEEKVEQKYLRVSFHDGDEVTITDSYKELALKLNGPFTFTSEALDAITQCFDAGWDAAQHAMREEFKTCYEKANYNKSQHDSTSMVAATHADYNYHRGEAGLASKLMQQPSLTKGVHWRKGMDKLFEHWDGSK